MVPLSLRRNNRATKRKMVLSAVHVFYEETRRKETLILLFLIIQVFETTSLDTINYWEKEENKNKATQKSKFREQTVDHRFATKMKRVFCFALWTRAEESFFVVYLQTNFLRSRRECCVFWYTHTIQTQAIQSIFLNFFIWLN